MHTIKLKVQDSVLDKVMYFLSNLPKNEVEVIEESNISKNKKTDKDFIAYFSANPIVFEDEFLTRDEANAR